MKLFFKWIGIPLIVLIVAIIIYMKIAGIDIAPPDVSDLAIVYKNIPEDLNAFTYLNFPEDSLFRPDNEDKWKKYNDLESWKEWDEELALEAIEHNKELIERFEKAMECREFQVPEIKDMNTMLPYLQKWRGFARFLSVYARHFQKSGNEKEAFEWAIKIIQFGHRTEDSRGSIIGYLVGTAVKNIGLTTVRRLLVETTLDPDELKNFIYKITPFEANIDGLVNTFKVEYKSICGTINAMVSGKLDEDFQFNSWGRRAPRAGYFFKVNDTKRIFAEFFHINIENAKADFQGQKDFESTEIFEECISTSYLSPNKGGKLIALILVPSNSLVINKKFRSQAENRMTKVLIALKCYKMEHGDLPESLEQLIPDYFIEIPKDPYDGKPLRYSKEKMVVYSVYQNLLDDGGYIEEPVEQKGSQPIVILDPPDLTVKIDF